MAGYAIYDGVTDGKWWLVEIPDGWKREDLLPTPSSKDRSFDTKAAASERLSELLGTATQD